MVGTLKRTLTFSAWADGVREEHFHPAVATAELASVGEDEVVYEHGEALTAVEVIADGDGPVKLRLLALHDADNAPSAGVPALVRHRWTMATAATRRSFTHVLIWDDKVVAHDAHANAPGLGRLAEYIRAKAEKQRVIFRALYEQGVADQLADLDGVRTVEYGIYRPHKKQQAHNQGLFGSATP